MTRQPGSEISLLRVSDTKLCLHKSCCLNCCDICYFCCFYGQLPGLIFLEQILAVNLWMR